MELTALYFAVLQAFYVVLSTRNLFMKNRTEILQKLAKWYQRAEEATSREQVEKILRKARKHARRLAELDKEG